MAFCGSAFAKRTAGWPTSMLPSRTLRVTTEGVERFLSRVVMTVTRVPSGCAMAATEFVVPRSMPIRCPIPVSFSEERSPGDDHPGRAQDLPAPQVARLDHLDDRARLL